MIQLRDYQDDIVNKIATEFDAGCRRICTVLGCGGGKTVIFSCVSGRAKLKGNDVLVLQHRAELIQQTSETLGSAGISHGIIAAGMPMDLREKIQVGSVQTVARRLHKINKPKVIIIDEAHHALANTWRRILNEFPEALVIGMTATPARMSGQGLGDVFDSLVEGPSVKELIDMGFLSPYKYFAPPQIANMAGVRVRMGDYDPHQLAEVMDDGKIIGDAVQHYQRMANGKRAIVYCASVEHSKHTAEQFSEAGYHAAHLDGDTHPVERRRLTTDFKAGKLQIITNCSLLGEGYDCPGAEAVILLRPTCSLTLFIQMAMRGMRIDPENPNKETIILDHVGNVGRHGMPDEDRIWSLEGIPKQPKGSKSEFPVRQCERCYTAHRTALTCPACGYVYPIEARAEIEQVQGELAEVIDLERKKRKQEIGRARSVAELEQIAIRQGYKPGWVRKMCELKHIPFGKRKVER